MDVKLVGTIPSGLPSFQMPDLNLLRALLPGALGIALISFIESIAASHAFIEQGDPVVDANQELLALGGLTPDHFGHVVPAGTQVGVLSRGAATGRTYRLSD